MKRLSIFSILLFTILCISCDNKSTLSSENVKEMISEKDTVVVSKEELRKLKVTKDARSIGPSKSKSQIEIDRNNKQIAKGESILCGHYVGMFGKNKITLSIYNITKDSLFGYSICAGNYRPIKGVFTGIERPSYKVNMKEPGDNIYDGEFDFIFTPGSTFLDGTWKPYKNTTSAKKYELNKREFKYDPTIGHDIKSYGSSKIFDVFDVENMLPEEIELERNRIYARHGYSFDNLKIRRAFDSLDWYMPISIDVRDELTDVEVHNIDMLYNYEDYLDEYYNEYGR